MPYGAGDISLVRVLIGDNVPGDQLLDDSAITTLLVFSGGPDGPGKPLEAAIQGALALAARYSRMVDGSNGDISRSYSQRASAFRAIAEALRAQVDAAAKTGRTARSMGAIPTIPIGGIDGNPDFAVGMADSPGTVFADRERDGTVPGDPRAGYWTP